MQNRSFFQYIIILTKGEGTLFNSFSHFAPHMGPIEKRQVGSLISGEQGTTTAFSLWKLQDRGAIFVHPATEVYEGMIIGEHNQGSDLTVNPIKGKQLTNVRSSGADDAINLITPQEVSLEKSLEYIKEDEYVEVTPTSIRLRKKYLRVLQEKLYQEDRLKKWRRLRQEDISPYKEKRPRRKALA